MIHPRLDLFGGGGLQTTGASEVLDPVNVPVPCTFFLFCANGERWAQVVVESLKAFTCWRNGSVLVNRNGWLLPIQISVQLFRALVFEEEPSSSVSVAGRYLCCCCTRCLDSMRS